MTLARAGVGEIPSVRGSPPATAGLEDGGRREKPMRAASEGETQPREDSGRKKGPGSGNTEDLDSANNPDMSPLEAPEKSAILQTP